MKDVAVLAGFLVMDGKNKAGQRISGQLLYPVFKIPRTELPPFIFDGEDAERMKTFFAEEARRQENFSTDRVTAVHVRNAVFSQITKPSFSMEDIIDQLRLDLHKMPYNLEYIRNVMREMGCVESHGKGPNKVYQVVFDPREKIGGGGLCRATRCCFMGRKKFICTRYQEAK